MNYYISDPHFGHRNIIRLCERPFDTIEEKDHVIVANWTARVGNNDHVYVLGDVFYHCEVEHVVEKENFDYNFLVR